MSETSNGDLQRPVTRDDYPEVEIRDWAEYLINGRLLELLAAASDLRLLGLRFDWSIPYYGLGYHVALSHAVGRHKWKFLANVTLSVFNSRAEDLVSFCEIHATTLQALALDEILLLRGSWPSTFEEMRRLLHLQQVRICGTLRASELDECWLFPMMGRVVQEYLLQGGDGPLLDLGSERVAMWLLIRYERNN
ncbi:hypothetical protein MMC22_003656 [Lobaria immixta]|nr:hypothetical protein [Lobaria immixta]